MTKQLMGLFAVLHILIAGLLFLFHQWRDTTLVFALSVLFVFLFLVRAASGAYEFGVNRKAFGREPQNLFLPDLDLRELSGLFRTYADKAEDRIVAATTAYAVMISITGLIANLSWVAIALLLLTLVSPYLTRRAWPGFTLVLGSSIEPSTKKLALRVLHATAPFNTVSLLNFQKPSEVSDAIAKVVGARISNSVVSWQAAVEVHSLLAKLIVLNVTAITPELIEEMQLLDNHGLWHKSVLYGENLQEADIRRHVEDHISGSLSDAYVAKDLADVQRVTRWVRSSIAHFPAPERPLSSQDLSGAST